MKKLKLLVDRLQTARSWTNSLLEDIEESTWFNMPGPGMGHTAWQVGHLAASQAGLIHSRCFGRDIDACLPANYREIFGRGSKPVGDSAVYPSVGDIRATFIRLHDESIRLITNMKKSELPESVHGDPHPMFATKEGAIGMAIMHETFHAGQLAMIRRLAGKAPLR